MRVLINGERDVHRAMCLNCCNDNGNKYKSMNNRAKKTVSITMTERKMMMGL